MKIIYLGNDSRFYNRCVELVSAEYNDEIEFVMDNYVFSDEDELIQLIQKHKADFVLLDYSFFGSIFGEVYKIVRRLRTCHGHAVGVVGNEEQYNDLKGYYFGSRVFFGMKGIDLNGLIYGILSHIGHEGVQVPSFVRAFYSDTISAKVPVKVDTFFPHSLICHSGVTVEGRSELLLEFIDEEHRLKSGKYSILKANRIGAKDLGNSMSLAIKSSLNTQGANSKTFISDLKNESQDWTIGPKTLDKIREVAVSAGERRKYGDGAVPRILQLLQYNWVLNDGEMNLGKNFLQCFVFDETKTLSYRDKADVGSDFFIFNDKDCFLEEISKWKPNLIVLNCKDEDEAAILKEIINEMSGIVDYFPYFALFSTNISSEKIRDDVEYHQIVCFPFPFKADVLAKVEDLYLGRYSEKVLTRGEKRLNRYERKFKDKNLTEAHFNDKTIIPNNVVIGLTTIDIELLGISEVEIFFRLDSPIEMGTKLSVSSPFTINAQVVEHVPGSKMATVPGCIRAIITFIKEEQLMNLRRYVNSVAKKHHRLADGISVQKITELKDEHLANTNNC